MGGDGGSITTRADMVRTKGYKFIRDLGGMGYTPNTLVFQVDKGLDPLKKRELALSHCALSQEPLRKPIVLCKQGNVFNKEKVLEALLDRKLPSHLSHIESFKQDLLDISKNWDSTHLTWTCALSGEPFAPSSRGFVNWNCGCLILEKVYTHLTASQEALDLTLCPACREAPFHRTDSVVYIVPNEQEVEKNKNKKWEKKSSKKRSLKDSVKEGKPQKETKSEDVQREKEEKALGAEVISIVRQDGVRDKETKRQRIEKDTKELQDSKVYRSLFEPSTNKPAL